MLLGTKKHGIFFSPFEGGIHECHISKAIEDIRELTIIATVIALDL